MALLPDLQGVGGHDVESYVAGPCPKRRADKDVEAAI